MSDVISAALPHQRVTYVCNHCLRQEIDAAREAALREGAEAMRECIVYRIWGHEWRDPDDLVRQIRALPLPEVK